MIKGYLKSRWLMLFILIWSCAIFSVIDFVTVKETSHIVYGIGLFLLVSIMAGTIDFILYRRKVVELQRLAREPELRHSIMSDYGGLIDDYYRTIFETLQTQTNDAVCKMTENYTDHIEYYSMWVHQIKTPISALGLMIQSDDSIKDKNAYYAELFRIEQYVDMVLQYLRMEKMENDSVLGTVNIHTVVKEAVKKFSSIFIYKHIGVNIDCPERQVLSDEKWLTFMVEQVLSNSLKYSTSGTISLVWKEDSYGGILSIKDEGIGISEEDVVRIFDRGYTGYNGRLHEKSTGIGLYMVKTVAKRLGIRVGVVSQQGQGTTIKFAFNNDLLNTK